MNMNWRPIVARKPPVHLTWEQALQKATLIDIARRRRAEHRTGLAIIVAACVIAAMPIVIAAVWWAQ